jgi:hypothetical protein
MLLVASYTLWLSPRRGFFFYKIYRKPPVSVLQNKIRPFSVLVPHINGTKNSVSGPVLQENLYSVLVSFLKIRSGFGLVLSNPN